MTPESTRPRHRSWAEPWQAKGLRMTHEPKYLRFFQARFERLA